jgi:hypothetical protein
MAMGHSTRSVIKHVPNVKVNHHHKTRGKEADVSCLSSVTIAALVDRKQGFVALHAILVKKRISLPSLPHSITKRLLQICEIAFCLKALFGTMMTLAPIYCTSCFWLCHKFDYLTSTSLELVPMSVGNISVWTVHHIFHAATAHGFPAAGEPTTRHSTRVILKSARMLSTTLTYEVNI